MHLPVNFTRHNKIGFAFQIINIFSFSCQCFEKYSWLVYVKTFVCGIKFHSVFFFKNLFLHVLLSVYKDKLSYWWVRYLQKCICINFNFIYFECKWNYFICLATYYTNISVLHLNLMIGLQETAFIVTRVPFFIMNCT